METDEIQTETTKSETMDNYVDGYLLAVPKHRLDDYRRMAEIAGKVWREHGALEYRECVGDDLAPKDLVAFPDVIKAGPDETVVFSWIVFESREHRDHVNAKVMEDPRLNEMCNPDAMPFDCERMAYGGFRTLVSA